MTDLEKRAEEMFNKMITSYLRDCGRNRDYAREIAIKSVVDFAQQETVLLSQHILDLQADKGRLTDENRQAKEIIENLLSDNRTMKAQFESEEEANVWFEHIHNAEQFLSEVAK